MKQPSIWRQIHDENAAFVDQFSDEQSFDKAGLTEVEQKLVVQKRDAKVLRGVTRGGSGAHSHWQVRFSINGRQEILFVSYSLSVAALMRDLLLTMLLRYSHCAKVPSVDPNEENGIFNLPLSVRRQYAPGSRTKGTVEIFLERVEKLLLDRGAIHLLTPDEIAAREQLASQAKAHSDSAAQKRYQTRRATQLGEVFGQIKSVANTCEKMDELRARLYDWMDRKDASIGVVSQQIEFMAAEFESLKQAVGTMTATFQHLIETAHEHDNRNPKAG